MHRRSHLPFQCYAGGGVIDATRAILELMASGRAPEAIPADALCVNELKRVAEFFAAVQRFTIALSNGDLTASLKGVGGPVAGGLKSLQASLRHLTWQTRQVAAGDFSQRVDFMGEFSASFNAMVASLAAGRAEMEEMNLRLQEELERQREMAESLRTEEERFRLITENVNAVIWTMDAATLRFTYVGPYITRLRGLSVEEALTESLQESLTPASWGRVGERLAHNRVRYGETGDVGALSDCLEVEQLCRDGRVISVEMVISAVMDKAGNLKEYLGISRDITARKAVERELTYMSSHDALTGLYNRAFLDMALGRAGREGRFPLSIIVADLDGLKLVNDTLGHAAGDCLLQGAASILSMAFRSDDVIARTGGDEFVVLLQHMDEEEAGRMLERVRGCEESFNRGQTGPAVRISLGAATALKGDELMQTLALADARMYAEKSARRRNAGAAPRP